MTKTSAMRRWMALLALTVSACSQEPAVPKFRTEIILRLTHTGRDTIRIGQPDTITVSATNNFGDQVSITFPNACQVFPYIRDPRGRIVTPDGGWTCLPVLTRLVLARNETRRFTFVWTGQDQFAGGLQASPLPPGEYFITATMQAGDFVVHAPPLRVFLQ